MSDRAYCFTGFAAYCYYLVVADTIASRLYRFDTTAVIFTSVPITLHALASNATFTTDAVYAPPKYGGTVMLVPDDTYQGIGGVAVFQSNDGCASATLLGEIPNNFSVATYGVPSATVQIAQSTLRWKRSFLIRVLLVWRARGQVPRLWILRMRWTIWFVVIRAESEPLVEVWKNCSVWLPKENTDIVPAL
jgi:hypothetical protein